MYQGNKELAKIYDMLYLTPVVMIDIKLWQKKAHVEIELLLKINK